MTIEGFKQQLRHVLADACAGGYFSGDDDGYDHDQIQELIEHYADEVGFDAYEHGTSYQRLADEFEEFVFDFNEFLDD